MRPVHYLLALCVLLVIGLGCYVVFFNRPEKTAFFYNQKVFDQFDGKVQLEARLKRETEKDKKMLDSLLVLIQGGRTDLSPVYEENRQQSAYNYQQLSDRYTTDIWKYINEEVSNYGDENGYDYIFGASGNGSLMFADSTHDITQEFVQYLNEKYN